MLPKYQNSKDTKVIPSYLEPTKVVWNYISRARLKMSLLIEINPQVGDIHCIMVLPEFNPQFVPCSRSDLSSSWDAYLGHVLSMLLGINEMCLPGRFLMWNVSRKLFHYYNNRSKLVCCEIDFFQKLFEELHKCQKKSSTHANVAVFDAHQKFTKEMIHISLNHLAVKIFNFHTLAMEQRKTKTSK